MSEYLSILNMLERRGWRTTPTHDGWRLSRHQTDRVIYMNITPQQWLCFASLLVGNGNENDSLAVHGDSARLYRNLLEENERVFMAKFALNHDGSPIVMAEVALKDMHPLLPYWAAESVARYQLLDPLKMGKALEQGDERVTEAEYATAQPLDDDMAPEAPRVYRMSVRTSTSTSHKPDISGGVADDTIILYTKGIQLWGWRIKEKLQGFSWHLGYRGYFREFDIYMSSSRNWLCFQAPLLVERVASVLKTSVETTDAQKRQLFFLKYLLHLNHSMFMAKLELSADNQILLLLELPVEILDFSLFWQATRALGIYLDRFEQEIQIMASLQLNKRLFELLHASGY